MTKPVLVAAAALVDVDGRVLIAQRPTGKSMAGLWEFPGGKVERGEQLADALARELREELEIDAVIGEQIGKHEVQYPNGPLIRLHFFRVTEFVGELVNTEFEDIVWAPQERLTDYDFLDGDVAFVKTLSLS